MIFKQFLEKIHPGRAVIFFAMISAWLVIGAHFMELFFEIQPCKLCLWQRIPHYVVIFGTVLAPLQYIRFSMMMQFGALLSNCALSLYHSGIERKWWAGLSGCSTPDIHDMSLEALQKHLLETQIVKCDHINWSLFGLSLTNYNFIICLCMAMGVLYCIISYDGFYGSQKR